MPPGSPTSELHLIVSDLNTIEELSMQKQATDAKLRQIEITPDDLPLHCPMPSMLLWNSHPRVYLPIENTCEAMCPYCGTQYILKGGAIIGHH
jgi:uncharacterized Zn-finger protein